MARTFGSSIVGLVIILLVAGSAAAATVDVRVGEDAETTAYLRYFPSTVVVWEGDTVRWITASDEPHTVTEAPPGPGKFDSSPALRPEDFAPFFGPGGLLTSGQSFNHTFDGAGTYEYHCKIHPNMQGVVHVVEAGQATTAYVAVGSGSGDVSVNAFLPKEVTVPKGSTIVWTDMHSDEPHTVSDMPPDMMAPVSDANPVEFDSSPNVPTGMPPVFLAANGTLVQGGANREFRHTFDTAGAYQYFCKLHGGMDGTVIVLERPAAEPAEASDRPAATAKETPAPGLFAVLGGLGALALALRRR